MESAFLRKLKSFNKVGQSNLEINNSYSRYSNQYLNADSEQKKWMDKKSDYLLSKIKTLESKY